MKQIVRHDYAVLSDGSSKLLPNGFLPVEANLTRTGIFTYFDMAPDGTVKIQRQLRHPDEVFADDTMASLHGLPATNDHPPVNLLNTDNAKDWIVGWQADTPIRVQLDDVAIESPDYIRTKIVFFDRKTIDQIQTGKKREISLGYTCLLDETPGVFNGQPYDAVQRQIRYNHLSLVDKARGGSACRIIQDSQAELHALCDGISNFEEKAMDQHQVVNTDAEELKTLRDAHERLKAERDELSEKLKVAQFHDADSFVSAVKRRVGLEIKAQQILGPKVALADSTEREIMEQVIKTIRPELDLSGRSDEYVAARFEIACEDAMRPSQPRRTETAMSKAVIGDSGEDSWQTVYAKSRAKMQEQARNAYKA